MKRLILTIIILSTGKTFASGEILLEKNFNTPGEECIEYSTRYMDTLVDIPTFLNIMDDPRLNKKLGINHAIEKDVKKIDFISIGNNRVGALFYLCQNSVSTKISKESENILFSTKIKHRNGQCSNIGGAYADTDVDAHEFTQKINTHSEYQVTKKYSSFNNILSRTYFAIEDGKVGERITHCEDKDYKKKIIADVSIGENDNSDREEEIQRNREMYQRMRTLDRLNADEERYTQVSYYSQTNERTNTRCRARWVFLGEGSIFKRVKRNCDSLTIVGDGAVLRVNKN